MDPISDLFNDPTKIYCSSFWALLVALSIALLVGATLMMRSFFALTNVNLGVNPANILYAQLAAPSGSHDPAQAKKVFVAVDAPMPRARVMIAAAANPGAFPRFLSAYRISCPTVPMAAPSTAPGPLPSIHRAQ